MTWKAIDNLATQIRFANEDLEAAEKRNLNRIQDEIAIDSAQEHLDTLKTMYFLATGIEYDKYNHQYD